LGVRGVRGVGPFSLVQSYQFLLTFPSFSQKIFMKNPSSKFAQALAKVLE
jgi:hypothetical protein